MIKIEGKAHDLGGGMIISRILPNINKRTVGPFVFLDHMGPILAGADQNTDVRPHPHIGLSTLTYLFEGRIVHRDSSGGHGTIEPGEVNWMTAGSGISHSERAHPDDLGKIRRLHGLQFWIGLPEEFEETTPSFTHYEKEMIPFIDHNDYFFKIIAGSCFGKISPVKISSPLLLGELKSKNDFLLDLSEIKFELALYVISGRVGFQNETISDRQMILLDSEMIKNINISKDTHFVIIGGEPLSSPRHLYWNFVSSSKERIEKAKKQWSERTFPMVPGETEFIPLPVVPKTN